MKEEEIRPEKIFIEFLELAEKDISSYFNGIPYYLVPCPACGEKEGELQFTKKGFDYEECANCHTLYVNPRPSSEAFLSYYDSSPSVNFWATHFYKLTEFKRREKIIRPKAEMTYNFIKKYHPEYNGNSCLVDLGAGYGVFCEEIKKIVGEKYDIVAVEPSEALRTVCHNKGIATIPKFFENLDRFDFAGRNIIAITCFELIEHLHDPAFFIEKCNEILDKNALIILSTLTWDGFDLQVLRENSKSISPPHHINFITKKGIQILLENNDFEICELITPGKLDVNIVEKQINDVNNEFLINLLTSDQKVKDMFQEFLQKSGLSSHMVVVARKTR